MELGFTDRLAVVAGGSEGIGRAVSLVLAAEGCRVIAIARGAASLAALRDHDPSGRIQTVAADLSVQTGVDKALAAVIEIGSPDILVNSVGNAQGGLFWSLDDDVWTKSFELKVMGTVRLLRAFVPLMVEKGRGHVVNIAGNSGRQPGARFIPGAAANAALLAITKGLADEVAAAGVIVNAVNPGPTRTGRWAGLMEAASVSSGRSVQDIEAAHLAQIPTGRLSEPDEIARYVAFLCSPLFTAATGTSLTIDGGATRALA